MNIHPNAAPISPATSRTTDPAKYTLLARRSEPVAAIGYLLRLSMRNHPESSTERASGPTPVQPCAAGQQLLPPPQLLLLPPPQLLLDPESQLLDQLPLSLLTLPPLDQPPSAELQLLAPERRPR
ncbi:hypothetical protein [Nocardia sp. NPDC058633]|uniref:hypothetical protein n=1 Tax=Nocardia sp. NPDC058633 TaxID=3346568 RepID=UPI003661EFF7